MAITSAITSKSYIGYGLCIALFFAFCYMLVQKGKSDQLALESLAKVSASSTLISDLSKDNILLQNKVMSQTKKIDTLYKIRIAYIDTSSLKQKIADSIFKSLPVNIQKACKPVIDEVKSSCDDLRFALKADSISIKSSDSTLKFIGSKLSISETRLDSVSHNLSDIKKFNTCTYLFNIPCLSRTTSFFSGIILTELLNIIIRGKP